MFPAAFDYRVPGSLAEAVDILHQRGDDAKVMAGGQSPLPPLKLRFLPPPPVVGIRGLPHPAPAPKRDGHGRIGAPPPPPDIARSRGPKGPAPPTPAAAH